MKDRLLLVWKCSCLIALACLVALAASGFSGCGSRGQLEQITPEEFEVVQDRTDILTRVIAARALAEGKIKPELLTTVADALAIVAADPLALGGPNVLTRALEDAGLTDAEAMLALMLVEDFLRAKFSWGATTSPLGPNARALVLTVANSIRAAVAGQVTPEDIAAAEPLIESVHDAR